MYTGNALRLFVTVEPELLEHSNGRHDAVVGKNLTAIRLRKCCDLKKKIALYILFLLG